MGADQMLTRHCASWRSTIQYHRRLLSIRLCSETSGARVGGSTYFTVDAMRELIRERMRGIGYVEASEWGSHSGRIGGATDLVATVKASPLLLQAKGSWASDIGRIYACMTRRCHLAASELT